MHVILTGTRGFIGGHLKLVLQMKGIDVTAVLFDETIESPPTEDAVSLKDFLLHPKEYIRPDSILIHCASAGVQSKGVTPEELYSVNVESTIKFLTQATKNGLKDVIVCGSGFEYGESTDYTPKTTSSPLRPTSEYAKSKAQGFEQIQKCFQTSNINLTYIRMYQVFGPGERLPRLGPSILRESESGRDLILNSPLDIRDRAHVCDVCEGIYQEISMLGGFQVINLCTGVGTSNLDFTNRLWEELNCAGRVEFTPYQETGRHSYIVGVPTRNSPGQTLNSIGEYTSEMWKKSLVECIRKH